MNATSAPIATAKCMARAWANPSIQGDAISQMPNSRLAHSSQFAKATIAASEIATMATPLIQKSILAVPLVSLNSQGDANSSAASATLYKSSTDSLRHFFMASSFGWMGC